MNYLSAYYNLLDNVSTRLFEKGLQRHRIIPGYQGGKYTDDNIVFVTLKEHRVLHKLRYKIWNNWQDKAAAKFLGNKLPYDEWVAVRKKAASLGGQKVAQLKREGKLPKATWPKGLKRGPEPEEVKLKKSKTHIGMKVWNNGIETKRCKACPGPEWKQGRLDKSKFAIPILFKGKEYPSISAAKEDTGSSHTTVRKYGVMLPKQIP